MGNPHLQCCGCRSTPKLSPPVFSCPNSGDGRYHFLRRRFKRPLNPPDFSEAAGPRNPYLEFRRFFGVEHVARENSAESVYTEVVGEIDDGLKFVTGKGFLETPTRNEPLLAHALGFSVGSVFAKDETGNVTGSHKARHLMGTMIYLEVLRRIGLLQGAKPGLAIYSCGNAALGAAAVARAAGYKLHVFVPPDVNPNVKRQLEQYEAVIHICERQAGESGDPCYNRFAEAVKSGCLPFSCSGPDNWSNIEGGQTLGFEFISRTSGAEIGHLVIQVGGGALASSTVGAYEDMGLLDSPHAPRIHVAQTFGGYPLVRAYYLILAMIARNVGVPCALDTAHDHGLNERIAAYVSAHPNEIIEVAELLRFPMYRSVLYNALAYAGEHPEQFMWPWETAPHSIAHGILDDVTYDWLQVVTGMLSTGGMAVLATEDVLTSANRLVKETTSVNADPTGTASVAGLAVLRKLGAIRPSDNAGVFLTGVERG